MFYILVFLYDKMNSTILTHQPLPTVDTDAPVLRSIQQHGFGTYVRTNHGLARRCLLLHRWTLRPLCSEGRQHGLAGAAMWFRPVEKGSNKGRVGSVESKAWERSSAMGLWCRFDCLKEVHNCCSFSCHQVPSSAFFLIEYSRQILPVDRQQHWINNCTEFPLLDE